MTTISRTTPYAWPYDGGLEPSRCAVVRVVSGVGPVPSGPEKDRADEVVAAVTRFGGTVITVITVPPGRGRRPVGPAPVDDHVMTAQGIDGFYGSPLDSVLRSAGLDRLLLVGDGLETCVHSTMRSANDRGYECLLVADACRPLDPDLVPASISQIEMSGGIFGAVGRTADVCSTLDLLVTTPERDLA